MTQHPKITTFVMFDGRAEEAMALYTSLFEDGEVFEVVRFGPDGPGREGSVQQASFRMAGQVYRAFDSPVEHEIGHNPYLSLFVECDSEAEIRRLVDVLSAGGEQPMPLDDYGFSALFAWVTDRFGVPWQLNLARPEA